MRLPAQLSRPKTNVHKNDFGHVLILAGSRTMLGASALTSLAALRGGAGLVTLGIPKSLNAAAHKKISPAIMTLPLNETPQQTFSYSARTQVLAAQKKFNIIALGPGISQNKQTQRFIRTIIQKSLTPLVIDADALNALAENPNALADTSVDKIVTPHPGEMARLTRLPTKTIEKNRTTIASSFSRKHKCITVLKGFHTIVSDIKGKTYINKTGNPGMATAGSGDVLTGLIAAFYAQGLNSFDAAKYGVYVHGKAGDRAAKKLSKTSLIATDIIDSIPNVLK